MNLHANAALSLKGRRELCLAVVEQNALTPPVGRLSRSRDRVPKIPLRLVS